jgi:hypothetical protein
MFYPFQYLLESNQSMPPFCMGENPATAAPNPNPEDPDAGGSVSVVKLCVMS